jgi:hypothetical protein
MSGSHEMSVQFDSPEDHGTRLPWPSTSLGHVALNGQRRVRVKV